MIKTMTLRTYFVFFLLSLSFVGAPVMASANTMTYAEGRAHAVLLEQIKTLLAEVVRLQELLAQRQDRTLSSTYTPYETVIFPLKFENIYEIKNGDLRRVGGVDTTKVADKQLFDLFTDTIGEKEVDTYVKDWRVFKDEDSDLGAFVELIAGTDEWVVGVNRANYVAGDEQLTRAFANLFIHEYAHILLFDETAFESAFSDKFWSAADARHAAKVAQAGNQFSILNNYYNENRSRFVSDYATLSEEEDMAETFVAFVREGRPTGNTVRDQKVLQFYASALFVKERTKLRANLVALGAL